MVLEQGWANLLIDGPRLVLGFMGIVCPCRTSPQSDWLLLLLPVFQDGDGGGEDADQLDVHLPLLLPQGECEVAGPRLPVRPCRGPPHPSVCLTGSGGRAALHAVPGHQVPGGQRSGGRRDGEGQAHAQRQPPAAGGRRLLRHCERDVTPGRSDGSHLGVCPNLSHLSHLSHLSQTLTVLVKNGVEVQHCPVKVLDTDTITQVPVCLSVSHLPVFLSISCLSAPLVCLSLLSVCLSLLSLTSVSPVCV